MTTDERHLRLLLGMSHGSRESVYRETIRAFPPETDRKRWSGNMSWAWVKAYRVSRRLKREWATYLASVDALEQNKDSGGAKGVNASPDATMAVSNSLVSSNAKLDVFLKDFIESLNESVEQSKKPGAAKFSVEAVYGDCQSLLLDLVKATKRLVSVFKKQRMNKVKKKQWQQER